MNNTAEDLMQEPQTGLAASMPPILYDSLAVLMRRVYSLNVEPAVRSVMITATRPGSGVSYISSCLSILLAEVFGTTLLADGRVIVELARRQVRPMQSDCTTVRHSRLSVLGSSEVSDLIGGHTERKKQDIKSVVGCLLDEFKYVIVDAPALSISKVAQAISPHLDGVLLVVVPNETDVFDISIARQKLVSMGAHVLGAIYNATLDPSRATAGITLCND